MKLSALAIVSGLAAFAFAAPAPTSYVVHEKRECRLKNGLVAAT
jgi:tripeptidyl-peptidase-1